MYPGNSGVPRHLLYSLALFVFPDVFCVPRFHLSSLVLYSVLPFVFCFFVVCIPLYRLCSLVLFVFPGAVFRAIIFILLHCLHSLVLFVIRGAICVAWYHLSAAA